MCCLVLLATFGQARGQYSLTLVQPNELTLANADIWNCIITNAGNPTGTYLHGVVTEVARGRMLEMRSATFLLANGTTMFNTGNYEALSPEQTIYQDNDFYDHVVRTNTVPNGSYTICLTLFDANGTSTLASNCASFTVSNLTPPSLVSPIGDVICEPYPFFIWTPFRPMDAQGVQYRMIIVEMLANQSPQSALHDNPAWFTQEFISGPLFQYPFTGLPFTPGSRYAWMVEVTQNGKRITGSDLGTFTWENCLEAPVVADLAVPEQVNKRRPGRTYYDLTPHPSDEVGLVDGNGLSVALRNDLPAREVLCRVLGPGGAVMHTLPVRLVKGYNYLDFDVSGWAIEPGKIHILSFTDPSGRSQQLRFIRMN